MRRGTDVAVPRAACRANASDSVLGSIREAMVRMGVPDDCRADTLVLLNGDRLVGEIKELAQGES